MKSSLSFTYLADYPHFIPTIATWLHQEWHSFYPSETEAQIAAELETHLNRDRVPLTIVALEQSSQDISQNRLIGTVSLVHGKTEAPPDYADWSPWLVSLYVIPEKRGEGLGRLLMQRALEEADRLKLSTVYLWTEIQPETQTQTQTQIQSEMQTEIKAKTLIDWYLRQGWQPIAPQLLNGVIAQTQFQQQPVQIMRYDRKAFQDAELPGIVHGK